MRQKKSNLNEIGDTKRGQYMLGRTAARAADREDMNTLNNSLKRYNNGGLNSPFTKGFSDQTDVDVLGYNNSTIKARYNAYKMHDMKKQGKTKKKTYPIYIQKLAEMGIGVDYAIEKLMEVCPHLEYGYELDKEQIRHLLNKDERFNKTYGKIMYDTVMNGFMMESKKTNKKTIKESQLRSMIKESVKKILNEHDETMRDTVNRIITPLIRKYPEAYERAKREMVQRGSSFGSWWDFTNIEDEKEARELWKDTAYQLLDDGVISYERYVYLALRGGSR